MDAVEPLSSPGVVKLFETEIKACGFRACIMAGLAAPGTALPDLILANGWPADWFEFYTRDNFSGLDPVSRHGTSTVQACPRSSTLPSRSSFPPDAPCEAALYVRDHMETLEQDLGAVGAVSASSKGDLRCFEKITQGY